MLGPQTKFSPGHPRRLSARFSLAARMPTAYADYIGIYRDSIEMMEKTIETPIIGF